MILGFFFFSQVFVHFVHREVAAYPLAIRFTVGFDIAVNAPFFEKMHFFEKMFRPMRSSIRRTKLYSYVPKPQRRPHPPVHRPVQAHSVSFALALASAISSSKVDNRSPAIFSRALASSTRAIRSSRALSSSATRTTFGLEERRGVQGRCQRSVEGTATTTVHVARQLL